MSTNSCREKAIRGRVQLCRQNTGINAGCCAIYVRGLTVSTTSRSEVRVEISPKVEMIANPMARPGAAVGVKST
jgi:hypothetical protein